MTRDAISRQDGSTPTPPAPSPYARDTVLLEAARSCTRFLNGHGSRRVDTLLSTIPADTEPDYYGVGGVVDELEAEVATLLGKEAALFFPTGTMAQQAVLRIHADRRAHRTVVFHSSCHLDTREERAYERLHALCGVPVGLRDEPLTAASLSRVREPIGALLLELPQRELGGTLPDWDELQLQVSWARERGAAVHLDGARLWESTPFYLTKHGKSLSDIAGLFDTVYVSFYKGLGGIGGACVAGDKETVDELSTWRTRHGGRCVGLWPYAASALTALRLRLPSMMAYYEHALSIGEALRDLTGVEVVPDPVQSPLMHLRLPIGTDEARERILAIARSAGLWTFARPFFSEGPRLQRFELHVGDATLQLSVAEIRDTVDHLVTGAHVL